MALEDTYIFKNSTDVKIVEGFATDILGWGKTFAFITIAPDHSVANWTSDNKGGINSIGVKMIPDKKFDESFALLK